MSETESTPSSFSGRRLVIVGNTNAGKTTLGNTLSHQLKIPHIELDAIYWGPDWTPTPTSDMRQQVLAFARQDAWVMDGNYSKVRDIIWQHADTLIWLDYALPVILYRLLRRSTRRVFRQEELWNGNRETLRNSLFSRESLLLWALKKHRTRPREYLAQLGDPAYAHLTIYRFRTPAATTRWLQRLP